MRNLLLVLLVGLGCREPFGTDRHDLVGFRVAGVSVARVDEELVASAAVIVDGHPWSDRPVELAWHWVDDDDPDTIAALGVEGAVANGPEPRLTVPEGPAVLALVAEHPSGAYRAFLRLDGPPGPAPSLSGVEAFAAPLSLSSVTAADLELDARRARADGEAADGVEVGGFARLRAAVEEGVRVRWMSTAPGGTFLELDRRTTDWAAGNLIVDDDEIEEAEPGPAGARTVLALALDGAEGGANRWAARDLWVGDLPRGLWTTSDRWLGVDGTVSSDFVRGVLVADDAAPTGLALTGVEDVSDGTDPGTDGLCVGVSGPFDPTWMLEQRCTREDVVGRTVVVEVR